jgi:predicted alpha-1,6-mannanase (GH76 family)
MVSGTTDHQPAVENTFDRNSSHGFLNNYYDDEGWWALAWIRAFDWTQNPAYLNMASSIFDDMAGGWDDTCGGGIWWSKANTYKNAIANELFGQSGHRSRLAGILRRLGQPGIGVVLSVGNDQRTQPDQ